MNNLKSQIMKKYTYTFATILLLASSSFLTSCTADDIADDSKNQVAVYATAPVDPPVTPDRPK